MTDKELLEESARQQARLILLFFKEVMKKRGLSSYDVAKVTGYNQSNINKILNGKYMPSLHIVINIAMAIGINPFFDIKDEAITDAGKLLEKAMEQLGRREPDNMN